ncbi:hypothetical protein AB0D71_27310 [Streptomyces avermitilis]
MSALADGEVSQGLGDVGLADPDQAEQDDGFARVEPAQGAQVADLGRGQFRGGGEVEYNIRRSYRDLIHTAYENAAIVPADPIPDHVKNAQFEISGTVKTGDDERERGTREAAPLRIDGRRGNGDEIEELWAVGELTDDEFEDHFIDDGIVEDIGEGTDGWDFPESSYSVDLR